MPASVLALASLAIAAVVVAVVTPPHEPDPDPSPEWSPAEVIRIQVEALLDNDHPTRDSGIATAFRFASPGNRAATGPLDRFTDMVHGPVYGVLLGPARAEYGLVRVEDDLAVQEVTLVRDDGTRDTFLFALSLQKGGACDGCWMTDAVVRQATPGDGTTRI